MKVQQHNAAPDEDYKNVLVEESVIDSPEVERLHSSRDMLKVMRSIFCLHPCVQPSGREYHAVRRRQGNHRADQADRHFPPA